MKYVGSVLEMARLIVILVLLNVVYSAGYSCGRNACYDNKECQGKSFLGICFPMTPGHFPGFCAFHDCVQFTPCSGDYHCGSLKGACGSRRYCECFEVSAKLGRDLLADMIGFMKASPCNKTEEASACHGVVCPVGCCG
ncbi:hypothetical protein L596_005742 [Steinernema carpocapsae]|uniref:Uncharacterized protein n=1 Tax=Steinernema carpocapsae TaxID=34508 RepID=A0A4V6YSZ2_STECR|nr:hypothetical protein L596_005742 [Steinernema carpocapsae]